MLIDGSKYELKVQKVGQHATGSPRVQFAPPEANANSLSRSLFTKLRPLSSAYLQEWNKVVLFQVIAARLGQEVHEFGSVVVTGLQSSGGVRKEGTDGCKVTSSRSLSSTTLPPKFFIFLKKAKSGIRNACLVNYYAGNSGGE